MIVGFEDDGIGCAIVITENNGIGRAIIIFPDTTGERCPVMGTNL